MGDFSYCSGVTENQNCEIGQKFPTYTAVASHPLITLEVVP